MSPPASRTQNQRGSALLIVFVMAAAVAILLYIEIPITAFEARRDREQDLINRGEEYAHAVKLFVRKLGSYPPTLDALSDTNRMRFLRHRYADPFTGKDDWRILHAGPGGLLLDSKVKPILTDDTGQNGGAASSPDVASSGVSTGGGVSDLSSAVSDTANSATEQLSLPPIPRRPPATAAGNAESSAGLGSGTEANPDPTVSLLPSTPSETATLAAAQITSGQGGASAGSVSSGTTSADTVPEAPSQGAVTPGSSAIGVKAHPTVDVAPMGISGGIAGVASRVDSHTIKSINEQRNYSLWEFYYNPLLDPFRMGFWVPPRPASTLTSTTPLASPRKH